MPSTAERRETKSSTPPRVPAPSKASRPWSRHWPLPVSLVLAVIYWLYLNDQVAREVTPSVPVLLTSPLGKIAAKGLTIRTPDDNYMITEIFDDNGKPFDHTKDRVRFKIKAPGGQLKGIEANLPLFVEVQIHGAGILDQRSLEWKFTRADVRDARGELTPFIKEMDPPELTVHLKQSDSFDLALKPKHVQINLPSGGDWTTRIFSDSISFTPSSVTLSGPKAELDEMRDAEQIFILDLSAKLQGMQSTRPDERTIVGEQLRLRDRYVKAGIGVAERVRATMHVAPEPAMFSGHSAAVKALWEGSNLDAANFKVSESIKIRIHSYNRELTKKLSTPAEAAKWVQQHVLCLVRLSEIDPTLDPNQPNFVAHPEPHWIVFGDYKLGQDLKINRTGLIEVERKTP